MLPVCRSDSQENARAARRYSSRSLAPLSVSVRRAALVACAAACLAAAASGYADAEAGPAVAFQESAPARLRAIADYRQKARKLSEDASRAGRLSYSEVLRASYPDGALSEEVLAAKSAWRDQWSDRYLFVSDYESAGVPVAVRHFDSERNAELGSTLVGRYEARGHVVRVSDLATDHTVLHEVGHSLQRKALLETSLAKTAFISASYQNREDSGISPPKREERSPMTYRRLEYLSSQDELEVRLQDLNRFYAVCISGQPIADPLEALAALLSLGMPVSPAEVREIFVGTEWEEPSAGLVLQASVSEGSKAYRSAFEDAGELLLLRRLMREWDPSLWTRCLEKILFEAPGHI